MEEKSLVPEPQRELAPFRPEPVSFDRELAQGLTPADLAPPTWKLVQAMSRAHTEAEVPVGVFHSPQMGKSKGEIRGVILRIQGTRTLWGDPGEPPRCASDDRVMPRPGMQYPGPCSQCPVREDNPGAVSSDQRRERCLPTYTLLVYDLEEGFPFVLRLDGVSASRFRSFLSALAVRLRGKHYGAEVTIKPQKVTNRLGTFYTTDFAISKVLDPDTAAGFYQFARSLAVSLTAVEEEEPQGDEEVL